MSDETRKPLTEVVDGKVVAISKSKEEKEPEPKKTAMEVLLETVLRREARLAQEEEAKLEHVRAKERQRDKNAKEAVDARINDQKNCKHLKGGKSRRRTASKDYALYMHTYINSERVIRCFLCGMKWKIRDTKEWLFRGGEKIPNPTGLSWADALDLLADSTNVASSSEIPIQPMENPGLPKAGFGEV